MKGYGEAFVAFDTSKLPQADAPTTFDLMLASGRRLAERLGGHLQDEQGSTLTAQRVLSLREELVHFEHVSKRLSKR